MARKLRVQFEGAIYHVTVRGVERRVLFHDDSDRERLVRRLSEAVEACGVRLYLFCLMTNHVHLVLETPGGNLSAFMHKLQTAYTVYFNLRHRRSGHLMQGRFHAQMVQGDEYLLKLSRYVHLNPVSVGSLAKAPAGERIRQLRKYRWSSYSGYAGLAKGLGCVDEGPILGLVGGEGRSARMRYRRYVESGVVKSDKEFLEVLKGSEWGVGDEEFRAKVRDCHIDLSGRVKRPEDVSFRRVVGSVAAGKVLRAVAEAFGVKEEDLKRRGYGCMGRSVAAQMLIRYAGMNQRDVAGYLGMGSGSAVCWQLIRLRGREGQERGLAGRIARVAAVLEKAPLDQQCQLSRADPNSAQFCAILRLY